MKQKENKWCYIENTNKRYIITNRGKVFSASKCDFLKPFINNNFMYKVKIKYDYYSKPVTVSIYRLLEEYFPESLNDKSLYCDVEAKEKYEKITKECEERLRREYDKNGKNR